jgi:hypothetical protein
MLSLLACARVFDAPTFSHNVMLTHARPFTRLVVLTHPSFSCFHRAGTTPENSDIPEMVAARQRGELEAVRSGELPYEELLRRANEERDAIASAAAAATATAGR